MVQREVADRFFAPPSTKAYGAVSVLVQLAAERTGFHPGLARGLPAAAERRLGARRLPPRVPLPDRFAAVKRVVEACVRAPAQDAAELARSSRASRRATRAAAALAAIGREPSDARRGARAAGVRRARASALA